MPLRSTSASNLYFANDARDLPEGNLATTSLLAALEVADVVARERVRSAAPAVAREGAAIA